MVLTPAMARFHRFGHAIYRFRWAIIATWVVLIAFAAFGAARAPEVLKGGAAGIPHSGSARAEALLREEFESPYQFNLIITLGSDRQSLEEPGLKKVLADLQRAAGAQPFATKTFSYLDKAEPRMRSADGHRTFFVLGIQAKTHLDAEQRVRPTRAAMAPIIAAARATDPSLRVYVTGEVPIGYDATQSLVKDTATAEKRILPAALLFLLLAFGALPAAGMPVMMGAMASICTLGMLYLFGQVMSLSALAQNISTMVGLGIGIDYSLIMVSRFREALAKNPDVAEAVAETVATSGQAVLYSGITVMIGFLALFFPGLIDTTSLAVAGSLTVLASVFLGLTLLPAMLGVIGKWIDWPFGLSRFIGRFSVDVTWYRWAQTVMKYPGRFLIAGTTVLLIMALPVTTTEFGQFSSKYLPADMESGQGLLEMEAMGQAGTVFPVIMVIKRNDSQTVLSPASIKALGGVVRELRQSPAVADVHSLMPFAGRLLVMNSVVFGGDVARLRARLPEAAGMIVSNDAKATVVQIIPRSDASYAAIKDLARSLQQRDWSKVPGFAGCEVVLSGPAAVNNDFEHAILSNLGNVVGLVFLVTFILLAWTFRSIVLPLKALAMNTLSVGASFGALVMVFQHGFLSTWVGFAVAPGVIMVPVPIIVFCCVFGLSMDYEVFLLSRIQEEYLRTGDNERAVATGLAATGGIITNAALIMLLVFGAFVAADMVLTKMLGFGLAVAVLVDALIIRCMLVPSFMALVGKWNWWPHILQPVQVTESVPLADGTEPSAVTASAQGK